MKHRCSCVDANGKVSVDALVGLGPLADVMLSRPLKSADEIPITEGIRVRMMIDTGAHKSVIDRGIAESLGLEPIRFEEMVGVSHIPENCPVFLLTIRLAIVDDIKRRKTILAFTAEVVGMGTPPTPRPFHGLLGRDFLRHVRIVYDGREGYCDIIAMPSQPQPPYHHGTHASAKDKRKAQKEARKRNRQH